MTGEGGGGGGGGGGPLLGGSKFFVTGIYRMARSSRRIHTAYVV